MRIYSLCLCLFAGASAAAQDMPAWRQSMPEEQRLDAIAFEGFDWWVASSHTFLASGYGGQAIWVHAPLGLAVAVTSVVSPQSQHRGQAMRLTRGRILQTVQKRLSSVDQ